MDDRELIGKFALPVWGAVENVNQRSVRLEQGPLDSILIQQEQDRSSLQRRQTQDRT